MCENHTTKLPVRFRTSPCIPLFSTVSFCKIRYVNINRLQKITACILTLKYIKFTKLIRGKIVSSYLVTCVGINHSRNQNNAVCVYLLALLNPDIVNLGNAFGCNMQVFPQHHSFILFKNWTTLKFLMTNMALKGFVHVPQVHP